MVVWQSIYDFFGVVCLWIYCVIKNFKMQKVCFQLFCFLTDFNFDDRFLEGMTGAIFEIWFGDYRRHFFCVCNILVINSCLLGQ